MGSVNCTKWDNEANKTEITSTNNSNSNDKISNKSIQNNNKNIGKEELKLINNDSILNKIESKYNSKEAKGISYENKKVGETIVKIEISESEENKNIGEFIIIMDISESMGDYVHQIINNVIPKVLDKLNYDDKKYCHLITFSNESKVYHLTKKDFKTSGIKAYGNTQMLGVVQKLKDIIESINQDEFINILSISDGKVQDRDHTIQQLELLLDEMKKNNKNINSQAMRFISSKGADPDTRLLCSLLKFNSGLHVQDNYLPITFDPKDEIMTEETIKEFSDIIYKVFHIKQSGWKIISDSKNMRIEPFGEKYDKLELPEGKSILFIDQALSELPDINLCTSSGESKKINSGGEVTETNIIEVYKDVLKKIVGDVINNKILNTEQSIEQNNGLIKYVEQIDTVSNSKFSKVLKEIQNDEKVNEMKKDDIIFFMTNKEKEFNDVVNKINEELKKKKEEIITSSELFLILDASSSMKNYINNFTKNVLYKAILNMGFKDKDTINLFELSDTVEDISFPLDKLKKSQITCSEEKERKLFDCLETIKKKIKEKPKKRHILIFIFSGEITDKENVRKIALKMLSLNTKTEIISRIIKYINKESDFEPEEDQITYGLIKLLNSGGIDSCKALVINESDPIEKQINEISSLIN